MPLPNPIRKEILQALDEHIIPALWQPGVPLGYVTPPLQFPGNIKTRLISKTVPRAARENVEFPLQTRWPGANLHASFWPYFGFIYQGAADERTLITPAQSAKYHLPKGVYAIRWNAPGVLLFPPGMARNGGDPTFWEEPESPPPMKILWISIGPDLLLHTHINDGAGQRHISHSLQINESSVIALTGLFLKELPHADAANQQPAQAILLAMMLCLQESLQAGRGKIANTSRSPVPLVDALSSGNKAGTICREAALFIEMHLHETLSLTAIAQKVSLSPAHLNRLFQRIYGISVMHYLRTQRIAASKSILEKGSENIAEIAQLVGFKRANLFCRAFRQETGLTPGQFRRQSRQDKSTFEMPNDLF